MLLLLLLLLLPPLLLCLCCWERRKGNQEVGESLRFQIPSSPWIVLQSQRRRAALAPHCRAQPSAVLPAPLSW